MRKSLQEVLRFLVVGITITIIDAALYHLLLRLGASPHLAKACSFLTGMACAYLGNRFFTFKTEATTKQNIRFVFLYSSTLALNVGVNALFLNLLPFGHEWNVWIAFIIATGCTAVANFIGMKFFIFVGSSNKKS